MRPSHKIRKMLAKMKHKKLPPGVQHAKIKLSEACPKGTIPILRVADKDLSKNISNLYKPQSNEGDQNLEVSDLWLSIFNISLYLYIYIYIVYLSCICFCNTVSPLTFN